MLFYFLLYHIADYILNFILLLMGQELVYYKIKMNATLINISIHLLTDKLKPVKIIFFFYRS